jgi:hypothetical protein
MNLIHLLCSGAFAHGERLTVAFIEFMLEDHDA